MTMEGLTPGTTYYFAIKAGDGTNWSSISNLASAIAQENGVVITFDAKINFQLGGNPESTPNGYLADEGLAYGDRGNGYSYGWDGDNTSAMRDRGAPSDYRFATIAHMYSPSWEIEVPNGSYQVHVTAGDNDYFDSHHIIDVEGVTLIDFMPSSGSPFAEGEATINVSDGRLTVSNNAEAVNNKVCFIEIMSLGSSSYTNIDCNGVEDGDAFIDGCGICVGGNTGLIACTQDSEGAWDRTAVLDFPDVYGGDDTSDLNTLVELSGNTIHIYPIPVVDILTISGLDTGMIKLYNMNGTLLHVTRVESSTQRIDMTTFAKGLYILNITNENGSESLTIQK